MAPRTDWISLVEACYSLEGDDRQWLDGILDRAGPLMRSTAQPMAWTYECTPARFSLGIFAQGTPPALEWLARSAHGLSSDRSIDLSYRGKHVVSTASLLFKSHMPALFKRFLQLVRPFNAHDVLVVDCPSMQGQGVAIGALLRDAGVVSPPERAAWTRATAHVGAGLRLRAWARTPSLHDSPVEAVLDGGGRVLDAQQPAQHADARQCLRDAVRRIDRLRSASGRRHPDEALTMWEGLVSGRWSLVDKWDTDGRRFVVALSNAPGVSDPRGLTSRERQVAEFVGIGRQTREIAYALGISEAAVSNCTTRACAKLGLHSRNELVAFFSPDGARRKWAESSVVDGTLSMGHFPLFERLPAGSLTDAEQAVLGELLAGATLKHIAATRGTRASTVASQVQAIYQKLGVHSRGELAGCLQRRSARNVERRFGVGRHAGIHPASDQAGTTRN